jgi:hypothetical protein
VIHRRAALVAGASLALPARAQPLTGFIEVIPTEGRGPVQLAVGQVVRLGRVEGHTVIDTAAYVQQRSSEPLEAIARRLAAAGLALVGLTDLNGTRTWLAVDRIVLVRESSERHAPGARAAIVMVGLRFATDVAVRETPAEVMAAIRAVGG